jgi:hypothetical protein
MSRADGVLDVALDVRTRMSSRHSQFLLEQAKQAVKAGTATVPLDKPPGALSRRTLSLPIDVSS